MDDILKIAPLITALGLIVSLVVNFRAQKELKRIDITRNYHLRYDQLQNKRASILGKDSNFIKIYWESYWRLQEEEFHFFLKNMVDRDRYARWLKDKRREYGDPEYKMVWKESKHASAGDEFGHFMTKVLASNDSIQDILTESRRKLKFKELTLTEKMARIWEWIEWHGTSTSF